MGNLYSGNIQVERLLKTNLPPKDSGDKWYLVREDSESNICEMYITDSNGKVIPVVDGTARKQINVLNNDRGYVTTKNISSLDLNTITENGKYWGNSMSNMPPSISPGLTCVVDVTRIDGNLWHVRHVLRCDAGIFERWKSGEKWRPWEQIATTIKTSFLCTANSGYKIDSQNCYKINDISYIRLAISKTDGSVFSVGSHISVATLPFSSGNTPLSFSGASNGFWSAIGSVLVSGTSLVTTISTSNTTQILISGVI